MLLASVSDGEFVISVFPTMYAIVGALIVFIWNSNAVSLPLKVLATNNICNDAFRKSLTRDLQANILCYNKYDNSDVRNTGGTRNICGNQVCACYFEIKLATDVSNIPVGNGQYKFSIVKARDLCDQYNATLPTIHDPYEFNGGIIDLTASKTCRHKGNLPNMVALGMTKGDGDQIGSWDDNMAVNPLESSWYSSWIGNDSLHAHDTFTMTDGKNLYTHKMGDATEKVLVICKQELLGRRVLPIIPSITDDHGEHGKSVDDHGGDRVNSRDHGKNTDDHVGNPIFLGGNINGGKNSVMNTDDQGRNAATAVTTDDHSTTAKNQTGNGNGAENLKISTLMLIMVLLAWCTFIEL